jgi:hypothetical protein
MLWTNRKILITIICLLFPIIFLANLWFSVINHYYIPKIVIARKTIDLARYTPEDSFLEKIIENDWHNKGVNNRPLIEQAQAILKGEIKLPGFPPKKIPMPFSADSIDKGIPAWQLELARFKIPDILINAYEASGKNEFLIMAKKVIVAWALYERSAWLPKGLLWNDHAVAARIPVIIKFWKNYRVHPEYDLQVAKDIIEMVVRSGRLLAKPSHFTFATNHGIIQSLALLEISLAFPFLPEVDFYKKLALERLNDQIAFILNNEGVVLEHSAAYQLNVLSKIGKIFKYLRLLNQPIPENWMEKYKKGIDFYTQILRPDGSLPSYGDTDSARNYDLHMFDFFNNRQSKSKKCVKNCTAKQSNSIYPVAGYSVWWHGLDKWPNQDNMNQTVIAWSYFPGHAHKHADEMSVLIWAGGHNWWTNTGFWPYGTKGRYEARSWAGSNAPHLIDESTRSIRHTRIVSYAWSNTLASIDLERTGPEKYVARRQVIQAYPNLWIVLDYTAGAKGQRTTTTWTTSSGITLSKGELPGSYILKANDTDKKLIKFILSSEEANITQYKGSFSPFAGWENNRPASAIVVEQSANDTWAAAIWLLQELNAENHNFADIPSMVSWKSIENWHMVLPISSTEIKVWRKGNNILVKEDSEGNITQKEIQLTEPPQIKDDLAEIHAAFENADKKYPRKFINIYRFKKVTYLLLAIVFLQELFFLIYLKADRKYYLRLRMLAILGWLAVGTWLFGYFL